MIANPIVCWEVKKKNSNSQPILYLIFRLGLPHPFTSTTVANVLPWILPYRFVRYHLDQAWQRRFWIRTEAWSESSTRTSIHWKKRMWSFGHSFNLRRSNGNLFLKTFWTCSLQNWFHLEYVPYKYRRKLLLSHILHYLHYPLRFVVHISQQTYYCDA